MTRDELTGVEACGFAVVVVLRVHLWRLLWSSESLLLWSLCSLFSRPHSQLLLLLLVHHIDHGLHETWGYCLRSEQVLVIFSWTQNLSHDEFVGGCLLESGSISLQKIINMVSW